MSLQFSSPFKGTSRSLLPRHAAVVRSRTRVVGVNALFGMFKPDPEREAAKERMWQEQQEILANRRAGNRDWVEKANKRRQKATAMVRSKEDEKREARELLAKGIRPEKKETKKRGDGYYDGKEDPKGGIIIPLAPFGRPEFDNGERFDLKAPYTDEGWVDPDADPWKWAKGLFGKNKDKDGK